GPEVAVVDPVELRVVQVQRAGRGERAAVGDGGVAHRRRSLLLLLLLRGVGGVAAQAGGDGERKSAGNGSVHAGLGGSEGSGKGSAWAVGGGCAGGHGRSAGRPALVFALFADRLECVPRSSGVPCPTPHSSSR